MKKKVVSTAFLSLLLSIAIASVEANPIPMYPITFGGEEIDATISYAGPVIYARVNGTYAFGASDPPSETTMDYPVPSSASNISVKIDETPLAWNWNNTHYDTVIGDYPFINWWIFPVPASFIISVHYEHPVPLIEGKYKFLYALGSARVGQIWKYCPANITTYISKDVAHTVDDIDVYLVTPELEPAYYTITSLDGVWKVRYTQENTTGTKDFLITIKKNPPVGGIYIPVNKLELLAPYIALASIILVATAATAIYIKHRKKKQ